nr:hypothetical protein [Tanacetum cinerariifolium]
SQWKFLIHTILQSMSAKRSLWNEFSSAMASAMICLATGNLSTYSTKYTSPALTQKSESFRVRVMQRNRVLKKNRVMVQSPLPQQSPPPTQPQGAHFPMSLLQEALDACAALTRRVEHLEHDKVAQDLEIINLKTRVKKLERANKVKTIKLRRLRKVRTSQRIDSSADTIMENVSNQGRMTEEFDNDKADIYHIDMDHAAKVLSMQKEEPEVHEAVEVVTTVKLITEVVAAVSGTVSTAAVIPAPVTAATISPAPVKVVVPAIRRRRRAKFNANLEFLLKSKEQIEEESRSIALINETPPQKAAKRRRLNKEAKDVEELKQHLEIVPDEDDDVFTDATPLARKVPVVDYQIIHVDNKPRYKIIREDDTHQLYRSFITMLKNFDREDLETLWNIVKESEDISAARQKLMLLVNAVK